MKKTTRKLISLWLFSVLLLSVALPAFAAPPEDEIAPQAACGHASYTVVGSAYAGYKQYYNSSFHADVYKVTKKCKLCYMTFYETELKNFEGHVERYSTSRCNGSVQSWYYHCTKCNHDTKIEQHPCPGAPHGGTCLWLPN